MRVGIVTDALARVRAAEAARGSDNVQYRTCPDCQTEQGRIRAKDNTFKRWSKCACPPKKSGVHSSVVSSQSPAAASSGSTNPEEAPGPSPYCYGDTGYTPCRLPRGHNGPHDFEPGGLPLLRTNVTRLAKRKGE